MRDQIRMDTDVCEELTGSMRSLKSDVQSYANELARIRMSRSSGASLRIPLNVRLDTTGARMSGGDAEDCLVMLSRLTDGLGQYAGELATVVREIQELFESGEHSIEQSGTMEAIAAAPHSQGFSMTVEDRSGNVLTGALPEFRGLQIVGVQSTDKTSRPNWKKKQTSIGNEDAAYFSDEDVDMFDGRLDLLKVTAGVGTSGSVWDMEGRVSNDKSSAGVKMGVLNGSANASASAGLWSTSVDKDGKQVQTFAPGVAAEIGAAFSVLDISGDVSYEVMDGIDVGVDANVKALSADARAEAKMGIVDGQLQAYAGASAEAIAAEASGSASVDVYGVKGKVGGSVNFGIGVHAEGGFKDGVLKFDVGASVGVGGSVSCELDISGLANNIGGLVNNIGNGIASAANAWYNGITSIFP